MDLILVRHAIAGERDARRWPDDSQRPLTTDGVKRFERAAAGLRRVQGSVDLVLSSPYVRAWQTAKILEEIAGWPAAVSCAQLEPEHDPQAIIDVCGQQRAEVIALVGHEPHLSTFLCRLLTGLQESFVELKKGGAAMIEIAAPIAVGRGKLLWLCKPSQLRRAR